MKPAHAAATLLFATGVIASASTIFVIEDLGGSGSRSAGMAIDANGQVVGYISDSQGNYQPFGSMPALPAPPGADGAQLFAINGNAGIAGNVHVEGSSRATLWVNGAAQELGGLSGADSYATGINAYGQVSGMATTALGSARAVIFSPSAIQDVSLPGSLSAAANSINNHGAIAGTAMNGAMQQQAYTWSLSGGYQALGTLGGANSYGLAINNDGWIAGHAQNASGYLHAFVWNGAGMTDLGTLGGASSYAYGINQSGAVVGHSYTADGALHAFLYANGFLFDLNSLIANLGNWVLTEAYAVNDAGQITGSGILNGEQRIFRLTPVGGSLSPSETAAVPEPGSLWLATAGAAAFLIRRLRRS